ncbi:hypothetical protein Tco_0189734 [Tanacetum coccineum]
MAGGGGRRRILVGTQSLDQAGVLGAIPTAVMLNLIEFWFLELVSLSPFSVYCFIYGPIIFVPGSDSFGEQSLQEGLIYASSVSGTSLIPSYNMSSCMVALIDLSKVKKASESSSEICQHGEVHLRVVETWLAVLDSLLTEDSTLTDKQVRCDTDVANDLKVCSHQALVGVISETWDTECLLILTRHLVLIVVMIMVIDRSRMLRARVQLKVNAIHAAKVVDELDVVNVGYRLRVEKLLDPCLRQDLPVVASLL